MLYISFTVTLISRAFNRMTIPKSTNHFIQSSSLPSHRTVNERHSTIAYRIPILAAAKVRSSLFAPSALVHEAIFPTNHSCALQTSTNPSSTTRSHKSVIVRRSHHMDPSFYLLNETCFLSCVFPGLF